MEALECSHDEKSRILSCLSLHLPLDARLLNTNEVYKIQASTRKVSIPTTKSKKNRSRTSCSPQFPRNAEVKETWINTDFLSPPSFDLTSIINKGELHDNLSQFVVVPHGSLKFINRDARSHSYTYIRCEFVVTRPAWKTKKEVFIKHDEIPGSNYCGISSSSIDKLVLIPASNLSDVLGSQHESIAIVDTTFNRSEKRIR
jgi:hypothetical protein